MAKFKKMLPWICCGIGFLLFLYVILSSFLFWMISDSKYYESLTDAQRAALEELIDFPFPEDVTDISCQYDSNHRDTYLVVEAVYPHDRFREYLISLNDENIDLISQRILSTDVGIYFEKNYQTNEEYIRFHISGSISDFESFLSVE